MARPKSLKPTKCIDKATNRAFVRLDGKRIYLGKANTQDSQDAYDRTIGEWIAAGRKLQPVKADSVTATTEMQVAHLMHAFWEHAKAYYAEAVLNDDGTPQLDAEGRPVTKQRGELENYRLAIRPLRRLYSHTLLSKFGPLALECVQREMIRMGWARKHINRQISRVRHIFHWGISKEMVPATLVDGLSTVAPLRKGHNGVRETARIRPVDEQHVAAVLPYLTPHVRAMVKLQQLTGARSGELCGLRTADIDTTAEPWVYTPPKHKTLHHDLPRSIQFGPRARKILAAFLRTDLHAFIFSPAESEAMRHTETRAKRKYIQPSQIERARKSAGRAFKRKRGPQNHYTPAAYRRAIERACEFAFNMPDELKRRPSDTMEQKKEKSAKRSAWYKLYRWHPHRIRHAVGTKIRSRWDLDTSRAVLGHASDRTTLTYAERDARIVANVMEKVG